MRRVTAVDTSPSWTSGLRVSTVYPGSSGFAVSQASW